MLAARENIQLYFCPMPNKKGCALKYKNHFAVAINYGRAKTQKERDEHFLYFVLFNVFYYDGNRMAECIAVRVRRMHLDAKQPFCEVVDNISHKVKREKREKGISYNITTPKNNEARDIKIPSNLCALLKEHIAYFELKGDDFLFFKNNPLSPQTIRHRFERYIELAKVKRITVHQLRNSIASLFFSKGDNTVAAAYAVANRLGHSVKFALDTYGNLFNDEEDKLIEKVTAVSNNVSNNKT